MKVISRPASFLGLSLATALTLLSFSLSPPFSSSTSSISGVYALPVRSSQPLHSLPHPSSQQPSRKQHTQQVRRRSTKDTTTSSSPNSNSNRKRKTSSLPAQAKTQQHRQKEKSPSKTSNSTSTRNNKRQQQKQKQKLSVKAKASAIAEEQRQERGPAPAPAHPPPSSSPPPPHAPPLSKKSTSPVSPFPSTSTSTTTSTTFEFDKPLLIIPPPRSVWHAGSVQLVKWSKNYARQLPKDTTVDIILADAKTNKKIFSLKRFIPFRKGSAQVWVPSKIPDNEDASYVLILDLFHGKSQKPVAVDSAKASAATVSASLSSSSESEIVKPVSTTRAPTTGSNGAEAAAAVPEAIMPAGAKGGSANSKKSLPSILRRSDINIYKRAIPSPPSSSATTTSTSSTNSATRDIHRIAAAAADSARADVLPPSQPNTGHHQTGDLADDDSIDPNQAAASYYNNYGHDNYLRQEFPNVIHPIELEHSFGVHQKVYSRAPYTLEWKVPSRAAELLDYTATRLRLLANRDIDWSQHQSIRDNNITYQAKLLVELVRDGGPGQGEALEAVAVLARNVPVETKFQYLQIHDHVDPAFYRLRVQMLVVEVDDTPAGRGRSKNNEDPMLDGWDFAKGAQVIDRYESITRKFWVSAGAL